MFEFADLRVPQKTEAQLTKVGWEVVESVQGPMNHVLKARGFASIPDTLTTGDPEYTRLILLYYVWEPPVKLNADGTIMYQQPVVSYLITDKLVADEAPGWDALIPVFKRAAQSSGFGMTAAVRTPQMLLSLSHEWALQLVKTGNKAVLGMLDI